MKLVKLWRVKQIEKKRRKRENFKGHWSLETAQHHAYITAEWFHILFTQHQSPVTCGSIRGASVRFLHRAAAHIQSIYEHVSKRQSERISEHVQNRCRGERSQCLANNKSNGKRLPPFFYLLVTVMSHHGLFISQPLGTWQRRISSGHKPGSTGAVIMS